ncbi:MAG: glycosyltransferase [Bacteroidaceae bacterium]|nr:glycosyltransferase [Bacteroidaceae bacterium]
MRYSLIIPVFNRPDEVDELLQSLTTQTFTDFEVLVVEDGSSVPCQEVVQKYAGNMNLHYFSKKNSGPGMTRNYGVEHAQGEYVIVLDSDCVLPAGYLASIEAELQREPADAFGGPDRAHESFTTIQKAINYAMTSFFTTGGIRGGKKQLDKFYPRSFNMGVRKEVYRKLGGFSKMRFGEDIDFSIRIFKGGYKCRLFPEAWVWHKRRTDLTKFFRQVHNSGIARIHLSLMHPESLKPVHYLPAAFTVGCTLLVLFAAVCRVMGVHGFPICNALWRLALLPIFLFALLVFVDATIRNRSLKVGFWAMDAAFVQLVGYGTGFIRAWWVRRVLHKGEFTAFEKTFYD